MPTTSGRCYVTSDVSIDRWTPQILGNFRRESDSSTLECTERSRSFQGQLRARQESFTDTRDQRSDTPLALMRTPWAP